jgi:hypothetical protein
MYTPIVVLLESVLTLPGPRRTSQRCAKPKYLLAFEEVSHRTRVCQVGDWGLDGSLKYLVFSQQCVTTINPLFEL